MPTVNEWGTLKKVVVGTATGARIPDPDISMRTVNYADKSLDYSPLTGPYPRQVIDEANEDLEDFCAFLKNERVEVVRPDNNYPMYYNYCPRDSVVTYSTDSIATPMPIRARKNEYYSFLGHLNNVIDLQTDHKDTLYNLGCIGNPDILALQETYPAFDAANVIKTEGDLLYLVSNSGNYLGAKLLQETLGNNVNVRVLSGVYSYMHIDSTVAFLREGLMLINPSRITDVKSQIPHPFNRWDYITCPEPIDIGYYGDYCNASNWINMNLFSVSPNLVALEQHQIPLAKELKKYGIESALLPMRHQRTLGGGFHCVTLDLDRYVD